MKQRITMTVTSNNKMDILLNSMAKTKAEKDKEAMSQCEDIAMTLNASLGDLDIRFAAESAEHLED